MMRSLGLVLCILFLAGFGESPQTTTLQDSQNGTGGQATYQLSGIGGDRASQARALQMMQSMPSQFNCENSNNEFVCLVCNCFHEGRGESFQGQVDIARVVYTREMSGHYPASVCGVVYQSSQFSWTLNSASRRRVIGPRSDGFNQCVRSTQASLSYKGKWFASHYHTTSSNPYWASSCRGAQVVGNHRFYTGGCGGVRVRTNYESAPSQGVDGTGV
jgi:N-acetylmuramoyl-L-alanine amidase